MGEDRYFKFDIQIDHDKYYRTDDHLPTNGAGSGSRGRLLKL